MSGARIALSGGLSMADGDHDHAIITMCIGVGQGIAALLSRP